ncbi:MAG TPA: ABC transporter ATP-binding protein [Patescibacteria group bacterium]|nr:ABC transporter ATP-binding protein [Patescibacteria group bacterium]
MAKTKSIDRETLRLFWKTGLQSKRLFILAGLYPIGVVTLSTMVPLFIGKILASISHGGSNSNHYFVLLLIAAIVGAMCSRYGFMHLLRYQAMAMSRLQAMALETLLKRSTGFHNNNVGGKLVSDATDFPSAFSMLANAFFINLVPFSIILIVGSAIVFAASWQLGLLVALMAFFALGSGILDSRRRAPLRAKRLIATKAVTSHLADTIVNVQTVKTFAREDQELKDHKKFNDELLRQRLHDWGLTARQGNDRIIVLLAMQLGFVLLLTRLVQHDPSLLGVGIFAFSFSITLSNRLFEVNAFIRNIEDGLLQASPMTEIILETPEIQDTAGAKPLEVYQGSIELQDITFHYRENEGGQTVFEHLNLSIAPGEKVGLVGPSGGGKSTLTRLLLRFEEIDSGTISIDGQDISGVKQSTLRQAISYVPQEPLLFHRPIDENIAYGKPNIGHAAVVRAAKAAHADDFIAKLAKQYKTVVGERGIKLSGGQRQRIAIARAILKDAPILILDEATSALDSESEKLIQASLQDLMEDRTAIVVAHRLSTIQKMDRIIVLDDGKIVEQGSHQELLAHKGLYAKLWAHQSGGFIEE